MTQPSTAASIKAGKHTAYRHWRFKPGRTLSILFLTAIAVLILIPIVFTFLYSFFPKSEMEAYLKLRGNYDDTKWLDVLVSPAMASIRQYYKILIEQPQYLNLFVNSVKYTAAILLGQAFVIPLMAYALSRFDAG
jgi:ABC-type glycerol-3-phosphate transport system permease component